MLPASDMRRAHGGRLPPLLAAAAMSAAAAIAADAHHVDPANSLLPEWTGLLAV